MLLADCRIVGRAVLDGVVEDRRIRGQPRHRELVDIAPERPSGEQVARDVVEPETLAQFVELLCCLHDVTSGIPHGEYRPRAESRAGSAPPRCGVAWRPTPQHE